MGMGFNAFENFVETEDDDYGKFVPEEKPEEEADVKSKKCKKIRRK